MPSETGSTRTDAHARAAATKRGRSRERILAAGRTRLDEHGWRGTRMADVARDAGVNVNTVYNHFPTKAALVGHVCRPVFADLLTPRVDPEPVADAIRAYLVRAARLAWDHRRLALALGEAMQDAAMRGGRPDPADTATDPRLIVPLPVPLIRIIERGQRAGELRPFPAATDAAAFVMNGLFLRLLTNPDDDAGQLSAVIVAFAVRTLAHDR